MYTSANMLSQTMMNMVTFGAAAWYMLRMKQIKHAIPIAIVVGLLAPISMVGLLSWFYQKEVQAKLQAAKERAEASVEAEGAQPAASSSS